MWRYPASSAARTASRVSSGGVWKTPRPSAGISTPLLRVMVSMLCPFCRGWWRSWGRAPSGLGETGTAEPLVDGSAAHALRSLPIAGTAYPQTRRCVGRAFRFGAVDDGAESGLGAIESVGCPGAHRWVSFG